MYLISFEMQYGRYCLTSDLITDPETASIVKCITDLGHFQQPIQELGIRILPLPKREGKLQIWPREQVFIPTWKEGTPVDQHLARWMEPYSVIFIMPAVEWIAGSTSPG
jgi:hypothetical protein